MTDRLTIALAQFSQNVGDLRGNADAMLVARAKHPNADLIAFPELQLIGYPTEDLVLKPALHAAAETELARMAKVTQDGGPAMLVGTTHVRDGKLYNAVAILDGGKVTATILKHELPNYGVFDEKRVFASGPLPGPVNFRGVRLGVPICEDMWLPAVCECLAETGAELLISPNASPYELGKDDRRLSAGVGRVTETGLPLVMLNRVGGQDEVVFDGASYVMNPDRSLAVGFREWDEQIVETE